MKIEIAGVATFEARNIETLRELFALYDKFRETHKEECAPEPNRRSYSGSKVESTVNADKWVEVTGNKRFRITAEESAEYGDGPEARENAARKRLKDLGEECIGEIVKAPPVAQEVDTDEESFC